MQKQDLINSLKKRGFSKKILDAFRKVPRENFIPEKLKPQSYEDTALPIGEGQTISQPYTIATMLSMLEPRKNQKILEIGSGCGYVLALLSELVKENGKVFGLEIIKELAERSKNNLRNYKNVKIYNKNGAEGLEEQQPFDRILISAACEGIPQKILFQLKDKGILVAPVGPRHIQSLVSIQRQKNKFSVKKEMPGFAFVKFV